MRNRANLGFNVVASNPRSLHIHRWNIPMICGAKTDCEAVSQESGRKSQRRAAHAFVLDFSRFQVFLRDTQ